MKINDFIIVTCFLGTIALVLLAAYLAIFHSTGKLNSIWENKWKIIRGAWNTWFPNEYVERIAKKRDKICKTNQCGFYDPEGLGDKCVVPGSDCCAACGCKRNWKIRELSAECGLANIGETPLWTPEMNEKEQEEFERKAGYINEHK
jgi:hypothetical protein